MAMIGIPLLTFLITDALPLYDEVKIAIIFSSVFPSAVIPSVLAEKYGRNGKLMAEGVTLTTILSLVTIPLAAYLLTKYVSLGSVLSSGSFGFFYAWIHWGEGWFPIAVGLFLSCLIVWMHRSNIVRLLKGEERKTNLFGKGSKT